MLLTSLGRTTLLKDASEKKTIAQALIQGQEDIADYTAGTGFDAGSYTLHLLGTPITHTHVEYLDGPMFQALLGFNVLSQCAAWDGQSAFEPGTALGFYRPFDQKVFHCALTVGGTMVRSVDSTGLGNTWLEAVDLKKALNKQKPEGTFLYEHSMIKVYHAALTLPGLAAEAL